MDQNDERHKANAFGRLWDSLVEGRSIAEHPGGPILLDTLQVVRTLDARAIDLTPNPTFVRRLEMTLWSEGSRSEKVQLGSFQMENANRFRPTPPVHTRAFEQKTGRAWGRWSAVAVLLVLVMISIGTLMKHRFITLSSNSSRTAETTVAGAIVTDPVPTLSATTTGDTSYGEDAFFDISGFPIEGNAMAPTLHGGNIAIVDRNAYLNQPIARGDVVVLDPPVETDWLYIKRVIGLPNETVEIRDDGVYVNDQRLDEPYLDQAVTECLPQGRCGPWILGDDEVFVLGDNRANSADSRVFGAVEIDRIRGKVLGESTFDTR